MVEFQFNPQCQDLVNLTLYQLVGHPIGRNAYAHHPARDGECLEHCNGVTGQGEVLGTGKTRRPRSHDRHLLASRLDLRPRDVDLVGVGQRPVGNEALQTHNVDRLVGLPARAGVLTLVVAHAATDGGEGIVLADCAVGIGEASLVDEGHVPLRSLVDRAGIAAGSAPPLFDDECGRNGLRVEFVGRPSLRHADVEQIGAGNGTGCRAVAAASAFICHDVARLLAHTRRKVAWLAFDTLEFGVGHHLDIEVSAALDQLGRENAHRAVVGGESLVQLRHHPADRGALVEQVDFEAGLRQIERGLDTSNASPDDQHCADAALLTAVAIAR